MQYRGQFDKNQRVIEFAKNLEAACVEAVENGHMTKDLALLVGEKQAWLSTEDYMNQVALQLETKLKKAA